MNSSKVKIKIGAIEIEYEGSETFLKEELPQLLIAVSELYEKSKNLLGLGANGNVSGGNGTGEVKFPTGSSSTILFQGTTAVIAGKIGVKSGSQLTMAAAGRLSLARNMETFSRQDIINEMKTATGYFKSTYVSNLTKSLSLLVKEGKLNEPSSGKYALTAKSIAELKAALV